MANEVDEELEKLRHRAKLLNIKHYQVMGKESLKEKIQLALLDDAANNLDSITDTDNRDAQYKEAMKLVRLRISNMNPNNRNVPGTIITVHSDITGTVRKYIPFDPSFSAEGYHVPNIIYQFLKEKKFLQHTTKKRKFGIGEETHSTFVKEYALEELPPLTYDELKQLAQDQQARLATVD